MNRSNVVKSILYCKTCLFFSGLLQATTLMLLFITIQACDDPACTNQTDPDLRIKFQSQKTDPATLRLVTTDSTIRIITIRGIGAVRNPISGIDTDNLNDIRVPLSQQADTTTFTMRWRRNDNTPNAPEYTDTLQVVYQRQPYFVSEGCGFNYKFNDIRITKETFTSSQRARKVEVINPVADEFLPINIRIIFEPAK